MANINCAILSTGRSYPEGVLTNADLERMVETSDEWITTRTGIRQRHKAAEGEYTSMFAVRAARQCIERARIDPIDIDLVICATVTPDQILPSTGCIIQTELGCHRAAAFDLAAACSGFLYGLTLANQMVRSGQSRYALVIGAEVLTRYCRLHRPADLRHLRRRAGAALVAPPRCERGILASRIRSDGRYPNNSSRPAAARASRPRPKHWPRACTSTRCAATSCSRSPWRRWPRFSREVLRRGRLLGRRREALHPASANQRITEAVAGKPS